MHQEGVQPKSIIYLSMLQANWGKEIHAIEGALEWVKEVHSQVFWKPIYSSKSGEEFKFTWHRGEVAWGWNSA